LNIKEQSKMQNNTTLSPARVTAVHRERYELSSEQGLCYGRLKAGEYYAGDNSFPTVGDRVLIEYNPLGDSFICATLPRRSYFARSEPGSTYGVQAVAANFDYVFILQSMNQNFNPRRLERYLTMAWGSGAEPVVILTKADLADKPEEYILRAEEVSPGVKVHGLSSLTGEGLEALSPYLQPGKILVLLGSSGVGKSSLVNALAGEKLMQVSAIRENDARGRHTTTHRQLISLKNGAMLIDTPGMRELGILQEEGLGESFADVEEYTARCRFSDCRHENEPGCAVKAAIARGELAPDRWESYLKLKAEGAGKEELMRRKREWSKDVAKFSRQRKKEIW